MTDGRGVIVIVILAVLLLAALGPCRQTPDVPDVPPASELAARVQQLVSETVPAAARPKAAALAAEYRRLAAEIEASRNPLSESTLTSAAAAIAAANEAARKVLGSDWESWRTFYERLYAELNARAQAPDADRSVFGVGKICGQIAEGLSRV